MTNAWRRSLLACGSIIGLAWGASAHAQGAGSPNPTQPLTTQPGNSNGGNAATSDTGTRVQEIVVTAQKRTENIDKVGLSITALGENTLKEQNIQSVADIAKAVPGLSFTNSANNTPVYTLRGVGFYDTSLGSYPTTSVYVDQVPLPFPVLTTLTAFDLNQIEVLKGPQGTLFGQNSTGGAINYIAAKPTSTFSAGGDLGYGRFDTFTEDAFVSGPIADGLTARVALRAQQGGDWQHSYTRDAGNGTTDQLAGRILVDWRANDRLKFELNLNGWRDNSQPEAVQYIAFNQQAVSNTVPVMNYPRVPANDAQAADFGPGIMHLHRLFGQASLRADYRLTDDLTVTSISSYLHFSERGALDQDGTALADIDLRYFSGSINSLYQELRIANGQENRFRWIVGGNYSRDHVFYNENLYYADSSAFYNDGIDTSDNYSNQKMNNYAVFGSGEFDLTRQLKLIGGIRYTEADRTASICNHDGGDGKTAGFFTFLTDLLTGKTQTPLGVNSCFAIKSNFMVDYTPFKGKLDQDNVSWKTGLNYSPTSNSLFYVTVSKGYKAGEYGNINAAVESQYVPAVQESILEYEGGMKVQLFDRRLSLDAAGFYMDYTNKQLRSKVIDPVFGILDQIINIPKSHIDGFEIDGTAVPFRGLSVGAAVTYIDSEIDRYTGVNAGGVTANFAGTAVPFTPKWQAGGNARYEHRLTDGLNGFISGQLTYRSKTNAIVGGSAFYDIDSFTTLDAQIGIESNKGWKVTVWGKNLNNEYYWTNVVAGQDTIVRYPAYPVTYGVTLGFVF